MRSQRLRLAAVIRLAAETSGWGRPLPPGRGRGIAAHIYDGETTLAQVAEVSVEHGALRVRRFVCAIDCGPVVNPLGLEAVVESGVVWGLSQTLGREITIRELVELIVRLTGFEHHQVGLFTDLQRPDFFALPDGFRCRRCCHP